MYINYKNIILGIININTRNNISVNIVYENIKITRNNKILKFAKQIPMHRLQPIAYGPQKTLYTVFFWKTLLGVFVHRCPF